MELVLGRGPRDRKVNLRISLELLSQRSQWRKEELGCQRNPEDLQREVRKETSCSHNHKRFPGVSSSQV